MSAATARVRVPVGTMAPGAVVARVRLAERLGVPAERVSAPRIVAQRAGVWADWEARALPQGERCAADSGAASGNVPACTAPATHTVTVRPYGGGAEYSRELCARHADAEAYRVGPCGAVSAVAR
jgi:hypothetical protein